MDKTVWQATVHGVTKESEATQQPNNNNNTYIYLPSFLDLLPI